MPAHETLDRYSLAPERATAPCERVWGIACLLLAVVAIGAGWPLLLRASAVVQFDYNEGWNAFRAQQAAHLVPLYGAPPRLDITNYPPLSFHIVGLLSHLAFDVVLIGRLLSLASLAVICLAIRSITRQFVPSGHAGDCAALLFVVWLEVWMPNRVGVNDPQLLGMAFELTGFYCFIRQPRSSRAIAASAILFSLAVFTKHNLLALPLGTGASLLLNREWRLLSRWVAAGLLSTALLLAMTEAIDGPYFLAHLLHGRDYQISEAFHQSLPYLAVFLPFFGIAGAWAYRNRSRTRQQPLALSWLAAHVTAFVFSGGDGTARNMFFEAIVLNAIIAAIAFQDYLARSGGVSAMRAACLLAFPMLFPACFLPAKVAASVREWREIPRLEDEFTKGVALLKAATAPVVCENLLMCYRAGKIPAFDPSFVMDQIVVGRINECEIVDMVETQRLSTVEFGDADVPAPATRQRFTKLFRQTVAERYRIALRTPEFSIAVPAGGLQSSPGGGMACAKVQRSGAAIPAERPRVEGAIGNP